MPENEKPKPTRGVRRIPEESFLYDRIIPVALVGLGVLLIVIVAVAAAIFTGMIQL
jgi:hypothetical protein